MYASKLLFLECLWFPLKPWIVIFVEMGPQWSTVLVSRLYSLFFAAVLGLRFYGFHACLWLAEPYNIPHSPIFFIFVLLLQTLLLPSEEFRFSSVLSNEFFWTCSFVEKINGIRFWKPLWSAFPIARSPIDDASVADRPVKFVIDSDDSYSQNSSSSSGNDSGASSLRTTTCFENPLSSCPQWVLSVSSVS